LDQPARGGLAHAVCGAVPDRLPADGGRARRGRSDRHGAAARPLPGRRASAVSAGLHRSAARRTAAGGVARAARARPTRTRAGPRANGGRPPRDARGGGRRTGGPPGRAVRRRRWPGAAPGDHGRGEGAPVAMEATAWLVSVAALGLLSSLVLVRLARDHGWRVGLVDPPRPNEGQFRETPRSGGYGLLLAFWLAVGASLALRPTGLDAPARDDLTTLGMLLGSALIVPLAVLDDRRRLGPGPQLLAQCLIAAVPVLFGL